MVAEFVHKGVKNKGEYDGFGDGGVDSVKDRIFYWMVPKELRKEKGEKERKGEAGFKEGMIARRIYDKIKEGKEKKAICIAQINMIEVQYGQDDFHLL
jgi:hypothetical protein